MDPALAVDGVAVTFSGLRALDSVTLSVRRGELRAIIGPNGAGKTTLFNVISGLVEPTAGTIRLSGEDVTHMPIHARVRSGLSRTFQVPQLFDGMTLIENVMVALQTQTLVDPGQTKRLGKGSLALQAKEVLSKYGLKNVRHNRPESLSHGLRRRLEIALTVCQRPRVLLLDEPAAGLAREEAASLLRDVRELSDDMTIVLIEHDIELVLAVSDLVTVLDRGRVLTEGTPNDIRQHRGVRSLYLGEIDE